MNKTTFAVIFILLKFALWAQISQDPHTFLERTSQKYNALQSFSLQFSVIVEDKTTQLQQFSGELFVKQEKYFLTFEDQIIANDGIMLWNYQKSSNEVSIFEAEEDEFSIFHPTKILNDWNKRFSVALAKEDNPQNTSWVVVNLLPKQKSIFSKIRLFIDKTSYYIKQTIIYHPEGYTTTCIVTKFNSSSTFSDSKFTFNKDNYPHVQVNDMR